MRNLITGALAWGFVCVPFAIMGGAVLMGLDDPPPPPAAAEPVDPDADKPGLWGPSWRVVDGDTLEFEGEKIRLLDIDTPETGGELAECATEKELGRYASDKLDSMLSRSTDFRLDRRGEDRYGRTLAHLALYHKPIIRGERAWIDAGEYLIETRYAKPWPAGKGTKPDWCGADDRARRDELREAFGRYPDIEGDGLIR